MPKLTIEQLKTIESLTGKQHSIFDGRPRKTRRTPFQSFKLGLMIRPESIVDNTELRVLIDIYEKIFESTPTNYTDSLRLQLLEKQYGSQAYEAGFKITRFDKTGNFESEKITKTKLSSMIHSLKYPISKINNNERFVH